MCKGGKYNILNVYEIVFATSTGKIQKSGNPKIYYIFIGIRKLGQPSVVLEMDDPN